MQNSWFNIYIWWRCARFIPPVSPLGRKGGSEVYFVEDEDAGLGGSEVFEDIVDDFDFVFHVWVGGIDNVQEEIGMNAVIKGWLKCGDEFGREVCDETDGVRDENF